MKLNKKSAIDYTIMLIITLVIVIILFVFYGLAQGVLNKASKADICEASVIKASTIQVAGYRFLGGVSCPRDVLGIKYNDYQSNGIVNEEKIKKDIADEMNLCWSKMGGEKQLNPYKGSFFGNSVCMVCTEIHFDDKMKSKVKSIEGFDDYLQMNGFADKFKDPIRLKNGVGFFNIAYNVQKFQAEPLINTKNMYYIVYFTRVSGEINSAGSFIDNKFLNLLGVKANPDTNKDATATPGALEELPTFSTMLMLPEQDVSKLGCDTYMG